MRDLALSAIREVADLPSHIGEFLSEDSIDDVTVVRYASLHPGYPCWHWSVALVRSGDRYTVNEVWMEPGEGALPVPVWKPWSERVRPGDLGAGDVVPTDPADPRLTAGYTAQDALDDDIELRPLQWQVGLGRARVLSAEGLADAADRWRSGDEGPDSPVARLAEFPCSTCAWLLPIGGLLGQAFGVCAHDMSPSDGHVVAMDHGCGAHSDVRIEASPIPVTELVIDETSFIPVDVRGRGPADVESPVEAPAPTDDVADTDQPDDDAGEGDIAPPQDSVPFEESAEDDGERGQ